MEALRSTIRGYQARAALIEQVIELAAAASGAGPGPWPGVAYRCTKSHTGGKQPKVADLLSTPFGAVFVSRIPWARSDGATLRPWSEEVYLAELFVDENHLQDDDLLRNAVSNLAHMRQHGPGDRSWLAARADRDVWIREVLDLPSTEGRRTLWVRCPQHLDDFESLDPSACMASLRESR